MKTVGFSYLLYLLCRNHGHGSLSGKPPPHCLLRHPFTAQQPLCSQENPQVRHGGWCPKRARIVTVCDLTCSQTNRQNAQACCVTRCFLLCTHTTVTFPHSIPEGCIGVSIIRLGTDSTPHACMSCTRDAKAASLAHWLEPPLLHACALREPLDYGLLGAQCEYSTLSTGLLPNCTDSSGSFTGISLINCGLECKTSVNSDPGKCGYSAANAMSIRILMSHDLVYIIFTNYLSLWLKGFEKTYYIQIFAVVFMPNIK